MYFDFEDYHPDVPTIGRVISWREGVLLSIIVHLVMVILILVFPKIFPEDLQAMRARLLAAEQARQPQEQPTFVFVQPKRERPAPPPDRAEFSDLDRRAQAPKRAEHPDNPLPYSRGNSAERTESAPAETARGRGQQPDPTPAPPQNAQNSSSLPGVQLPEANSALQVPQSRDKAQPNRGGSPLGDALRNLQRYTQNESFDNQTGGGGQFGPEIQFDTKGVEFGPWIRRFIAQVKRNWFVPYAAMSMRGHVVITFNVHKDGAISDLTVIGPSQVESFNSAAYGALSASNPTQPLPPEYPTDKAFFTVTFFYNETPPR